MTNLTYSGDNNLATLARLNAPTGLAMNISGNLFITDTNNNVIRMINILSNEITTIAGTGVAGYSGGDGSTSTANTLSYWAEQNGASTIPVVSTLISGSSSVEKSVYADNNGTVWVEHYKVNGGGHVWIDLDINGSNANQLIWDFFKKHDLNGPITNP